MGLQPRTPTPVAVLALGSLVLVTVAITGGTHLMRSLQSAGGTHPHAASAVQRAPTSTVRAVPAATPTPIPPPGNDWPQYRFDIAGSGSNPEGLITVSNASQLHLSWKATSAGGFLATPAVVEGVVYATTDDKLAAYNLATGNLLWSTPEITSGAVVNSSVAVDAERHLAFYGTSRAQLYAVDIGTHQVAWIATLGSRSQGAYLWSSPLVVNGSIYIGMASDDDKPCVRGAIFALDEQTGTVRWTHYTVPKGVLGGSVWSSVTADAAHHLIIATTGNPCPAGPARDEEDSIVAMDWDTGVTVWSYQGLSYDNCDCDFGEGAANYAIGGRQFVVAGNKYGTLYTVSPSGNGGSPALVWSQRISGAGFVGKGGIFTPPTYADGIVVAAGGPTLDGVCAGGALHGFAAETGHLLWRVCTASQVISAPAASGGAIFVAAGGNLTAYNIQTGKQVWQARQLGSATWGGVAIAHGMVLSGTLAGILFAYALPTATLTTPTYQPTQPLTFSVFSADTNVDDAREDSTQVGRARRW